MQSDKNTRCAKIADNVSDTHVCLPYSGQPVFMKQSTNSEQDQSADIRPEMATRGVIHEWLRNASEYRFLESDFNRSCHRYFLLPERTAVHQRFTLEANVDVFFCDPSRPWQRDSNENANRLLRQYLPKGMDLSLDSQAKLDAIARQLNKGPRKTLERETPAKRFIVCVASTG